MMPWDMMVTVNGYWTYKFRNTSLDEMFIVTLNKSKPGLTKRQIEFESYISIASSIPSAITVILHAFVGNRFTIHWRALVSLIGMIATFSGIIVLAYMDSDDWATSFLISNLTLAVVINIFRALFRATNSANMGKFPVSYMGSLANGICVGGLIPVLVNIFFLTLKVDIQMAGFACFMFSFLTAIVVLVLFLRMEGLEFYQYYSKLAQEPEDQFGLFCSRT
ncbi:equilibrative nucleoside transporter 3-like [Tigriopus californicus]|uniref:equilibrative nucleoside transporter 3-like n=1 Tax=Tigriopus californicus TaxID=6832 RepID=UPI0027DA9798|nr:equilibrative nucleoside transporter 3-like [Tigriopus californicus]